MEEVCRSQGGQYHELNYNDQKIWQGLSAIYRTTGQLFQPYKVSSAVYTVISPIGDQTSDHSMQSWNSTTELRVHIAHK